MLSDFTKINSLLSTARQYVITDSGWSCWISPLRMRSLTSGNLTFRTLPIVAYETIDGQDANQVNPSYIQQIVKNNVDLLAAGKPAPLLLLLLLLVLRCLAEAQARARLRRRAQLRWTMCNTQGLAGQVQAALVKGRYKAWAGPPAIPPRWPRPRSSTGTGRRRAPARSRPCSRCPRRRAPRWRRATCRSCSALDATLAEVSGTPAPSSSAVAIPTSGAQGGAINATNGIPCVN